MDKKSSTIIGKDVIESLTMSMYEDSKVIYREYIQNAADQIDKAEKESLLKPNEGEIFISISSETKTISIEDNATGIAQKDALSVLKNIAQSTKQRGIDKGFRGIGRLGGLGYCERLIFETSFKGEAKKSIVTWDAILLKKIINNRAEKEDAAKVIDEVTTFTVENANSEDHYFKVILEGVSSSELLDVAEVRKYLSMVAPVPFHSKFIYKDRIREEMKLENISRDEYNIFINTEQLYKGYSTYIYDGDPVNKRKTEEIIDVIFFKESDMNDNPLYWGWYGITEKNQSLNSVNHERGFRLRRGNIQIGDEFSLLKLQKDRRFQFYFIGEIHALHPDLIPNARRDSFSENEIFFSFENKLKSFFHTTIHKLCYLASEINSSVKRIEGFNSFQNEFQEKVEKGFTDRKEHQEYTERLGRKKDEAEKAELKLKKISSASQNGIRSPITTIIEKVNLNKPTISERYNVEKKNGMPKLRTDNLNKLSQGERKFLGNIFRIIKNVLPNEVAENLIIKIEEELK